LTLIEENESEVKMEVPELHSSSPQKTFFPIKDPLELRKGG
jgi:hypothetical protein